MPRADRLRAEGEEAVGDLEEIGVEVPLLVLGRRAKRVCRALFADGHVRCGATGRDFPGRRVNESDLHRRRRLLQGRDAAPPVR